MGIKDDDLPTMNENSSHRVYKFKIVAPYITRGKHRYIDGPVVIATIASSLESWCLAIYGNEL